MIIDCPICGKLTCIHWPQFWPYVRGTAYYCSWTCMDVSLCRDMNLIKAADMRKRSKKNMKTIVTKEQKQKAVSMAIDGRDPLEYLREIGSKSPDKMWYYIKTSVKKSDPELYAKIPDLRKIEKKPEEAISQEPDVSAADAMKGMQEATDEFFGKCEDMGLKVKDVVPEEFKKHMKPEALEYKIYQPVSYEELIVREVEGLFGRYRRSDIGGETYIDYENCEHMDTISMTVEHWRKFKDELKKAAAILGVEL